MRTQRISMLAVAAFATTTLALPVASQAQAAAEAKTFEYTSKFKSVSTANGYPRPGGTAVLEGFSRIKPGGQGYLTDHLTITKRLAPNKFAFKGHGVDSFGSGEQNSGQLRHKFHGTSTVRANGSQRLRIKGHFTGGHIDIRPLVPGRRYRGASGHFKGRIKVSSRSTVIVGACKGELLMHSE